MCVHVNMHTYRFKCLHVSVRIWYLQHGRRPMRFALFLRFCASTSRRLACLWGRLISKFMARFPDVERGVCSCKVLDFAAPKQSEATDMLSLLVQRSMLSKLRSLSSNPGARIRSSGCCKTCTNKHCPSAAQVYEASASIARRELFYEAVPSIDRWASAEALEGMMVVSTTVYQKPCKIGKLQLWLTMTVGLEWWGHSFSVELNPGSVWLMLHSSLRFPSKMIM